MFLTNLRLYLKFLARNRVYTAITIVGFAVSLAFVIVLGAYVAGELSVDGFHENKDRIYLALRSKDGETPKAAFSNLEGTWLAENYPDVESYVRVFSTGMTLKLPDGETLDDQRGMLADSTFFDIFSFPLTVGDPHTVMARRNSAVVSQSFATRVFGSADPVGQPLRLERRDVEFEITGVFADFPATGSVFNAPDFIGNYNMLGEYWGDSGVLTTRNNSGWSFFVLERPGGDIRSHEVEILERLKEVWWGAADGFIDRIEFVPLGEVYFRDIDFYAVELRTNSPTRVTLYLVIVFLILVVASLNYVNMTVAQAGFRGREMALRKLHGARTRQIVVGLLSESVVVTSIAFVVGLVLAFAAEPLFDDLLDTKLNLASHITVTAVLGAVVGVALLAVVTGLVPAVLMSRVKPIAIVGGDFSRRVKGVWSRVLVVAQYTISLVLIICSAFVVMQSRYLATRSTGLDRQGVVILGNVVGEDRLAALKDELASVQGVEAVSVMRSNPFFAWGGNQSMNYRGRALSFEIFVTDTTFLTLFGLTVEPTGNNERREGHTSFYLNRAGYNATEAAETDNRLFQGGEWETNVNGIVDNFSFRPLLTENKASELIMLYVSDDVAHVYGAGYLAVKMAAGSDPVATLDRIKAAYTAFAGTDRFTVEWPDDIIREFYVQERRTSHIVMLFAGLAVLIMLMGIFAMSIYVLRQKQKEIAIRKVNGSTVGEVLVLLGRQSLVSVTIAFVVACPVAWWITRRWLEGYSERITLSPWVFVLAGVGVFALTAVCVGWQSWSAARQNPVEVLSRE